MYRQCRHFDNRDLDVLLVNEKKVPVSKII